MLKIPFGEDKVTGEFKDAKSVKKGRGCNCKCHECGTDLEAVHPKFRVKHFRHVSKKNCSGAIESLFHKIAKQILKENHSVKIDADARFHYDKCDVEIGKYGKRPDAYLSNQNSSLIVEIYFTHETDKRAVEAYVDNNERVLEIDISEENMAIFDYERLNDLVLKKAPRRFLYKATIIETPTSDGKANVPKDEGYWNLLGWILLVGVTFGGIVYFSNRRKRNKKRRRRY